MAGAPGARHARHDARTLRDAEALAAEARALPDPGQDRNLALALGLQRLGLLRAATRDAELLEAADDLTQLLLNGADLWYVQSCIAALETRLRRTERVRAALGQLPDDRGPGASRLSVVFLAEAARFLDDRSLGESLYPLLEPLGRRNHCWGVVTMVCEGPVARALGLLAAVRGHVDLAERHFEDALTRVAVLDAPPHRARIEVEYAAALLGRRAPSDVERARRLLDSALTTAQQLGMPGLVGDAEQALRALE